MDYDDEDFADEYDDFDFEDYDEFDDDPIYDYPDPYDEIEPDPDPEEDPDSVWFNEDWHHISEVSLLHRIRHRITWYWGHKLYPQLWRAYKYAIGYFHPCEICGRRGIKRAAWDRECWWHLYDWYIAPKKPLPIYPMEHPLVEWLKEVGRDLRWIFIDRPARYLQQLKDRRDGIPF